MVCLGNVRPSGMYWCIEAMLLSQPPTKAKHLLQELANHPKVPSKLWSPVPMNSQPHQAAWQHLSWVVLTEFAPVSWAFHNFDTPLGVMSVMPQCSQSLTPCPPSERNQRPAAQIVPACCQAWAHKMAKWTQWEVHFQHFQIVHVADGTGKSRQSWMERFEVKTQDWPTACRCQVKGHSRLNRFPLKLAVSERIYGNSSKWPSKANWPIQTDT